MKRSLVILAIAVFAGRVSAQAPFSVDTFDRACASAVKEKKLVLVDFYTTWCAPCKALDKTTWTDPKVRAWLAEKTVSIKIDAEKETDLAARYQIFVYPTILLLRPDGTEVDRIRGFRDPATFLSEAGDALAGRDAVARAKEKLVGDGANDPTARMRYGRALAEKGRNEEALAEFLWCFDHGVEHDPAFVGVRGSFLVGDILRLGQTYPPALDAIKTRRDTAEAAVLAGTADQDVTLTFVALNRGLEEKSRTLAAYDALRAKGAATAPVRTLLFESVIDPLLAAQRYGDVAEGVGDPTARIDRDIAQFEADKKDFEGIPDGAEALASYKKVVVDQDARFYETLVGLGRLDEGARAADKLVAFSATGSTYASLIDGAARAGKPDVAKALVAKGLATLPETERGPVREAETRLTKK